MRDGLAGLTLRGRAFLAAGITAICCAVLLGQTTLTRIGVLVVALPLVSAFVIGRRRYALAATRIGAPAPGRGRTARADRPRAASTRGRSSAGAILVEDQVPYALGTRPRFVLQGIARQWQRQVQLPGALRRARPVRDRPAHDPHRRPVRPDRAAPDGARRRARWSSRRAPWSLPPIPVMGGWSGSGEHRPQAFAAGSAEDVSVREYRRGDELRRVHWRSSARVGELMVRREEQPWEARATVLLDNRLRVPPRTGPGIQLRVRGGGRRVASCSTSTSTATPYGSCWPTAPARTRRPPLSSSGSLWSRRRRRRTSTSAGPATRPRGGLVVAVLGGLEQTDSIALRQIRHDAGTALAMVLDVDQWSGRRASGQRDPAPSVAALGWRAVTLGPRDRLDSAWRDLGRASGRAAAAAGLASTRGDR